MAWAADSSNLVQLGRNVETERYYNPFTGLWRRTRTISTAEIRGVSNAYANSYLATHASDTGMVLAKTRANDADAFNVTITKDTMTNWEQYTI